MICPNKVKNKTPIKKYLILLREDIVKCKNIRITKIVKKIVTKKIQLK
jgi:hypothetical protein